MHHVQLSNGVSLPLNLLTEAGISYLPCGEVQGEWQPLVRHATSLGLEVYYLTENF